MESNGVCEERTSSAGKDVMMEKYSLIGVDGNAFAIMGYTAKALRREGLGAQIPEMQSKAMSGDYNNLICVCMEYVDMANDAAGEDEE